MKKCLKNHKFIVDFLNNLLTSLIFGSVFAIGSKIALVIAISFMGSYKPVPKQLFVFPYFSLCFITGFIVIFVYLYYNSIMKTKEVKGLRAP